MKQLDGEPTLHEDASHLFQPVLYRRVETTDVPAVRLTWSTWNDVCEFVGPDVINERTPARMVETCDDPEFSGDSGLSYIEMDVVTVHGEIAVVRHGDWILPEKKPGRFYPVKDDVFQASYVRVTPT